MTRNAQASIYTFEFLFSMILLFILLFLYIKDFDKKSLPVFIITTLCHSALEIVAQGTGVRVIEGATLFNIEIGYPFICFILGAFEGGFISLFAYHLAIFLKEKDRQSKLSVITLIACLMIGFILMGLINFISQSISGITPSLTRRVIFNPRNILTIIIIVIITLLYTIFYKKFDPKDRKLVLYFFIGLAIITFMINIFPHLAGIRFIEKKIGSSYVMASYIEQVAVMYGYSFIFEGAGFLVWYIIPLHLTGLLGNKLES